MTDHALTQQLNHTTPINGVAPFIFEPIGFHTPSRLGSIVSTAMTAPAPKIYLEEFEAKPVVDNSTPLSPEFVRIMGRILLHLNNKVITAGQRGPLDWSWADFADLFDAVPVGEPRITLFKMLNAWYRTIYIRQGYWETIWRDMYEDDARLSKQEEFQFFTNMRYGSSAYNNERWRALFAHRNGGLVGKLAVSYIAIGLCTNYDTQGNREEERAALLAAGRKGLNRAIDKFAPSRGFRFSTYACWWIKGEMTALFKNKEHDDTEITGLDINLGEDGDCETISVVENATHDFTALCGTEGNHPFPSWIKACQSGNSGRLEEDYRGLCADVHQAIERLNDPRKAEILIRRYGLFGSNGGKRDTLAAIGQHLDISLQRVSAISDASIKQLRQDRQLRGGYKNWFGKAPIKSMPRIAFKPNGAGLKPKCHKTLTTSCPGYRLTCASPRRAMPAAGNYGHRLGEEDCYGILGK